MNKFTIHACPVCGNTRFERMFTCKDHYATGQTFELYRCKDCGFRFTQDFPVESEIGKYYETPDYISHSDTKKGLMNGLYHSVRKHMLDRKANLVAAGLGKKTGRLLDIGTGTGYFPHAMKIRGWEVEAIERNAQARQFASDRFQLEVRDDTALTSLPAGSFDAITLWHVMEHLEKLNETWEQLFRLLDDDGILVVAVPNCNAYDARKYKENWAAYDVPRHLWHFTPDTMQDLAGKHRFVLKKKHPMPFDAFYVSILSEKYKKSSMPFLRGMATGAAAWFSANGKPDSSSSVIYIFKKAKNGEK